MLERNRLIAEFAPMARRVALRVARRTPAWIASEDLISAAMVGLAEAADRYDASRGEPFIAFATKRVRGSVLDELRRGDPLSRSARRSARQLGETMRELEHRLGRAPEDQEVAAAIGVSVEEYQDDLAMLPQISTIGLEVVDAAGLGGFVAASDAPSPAALLEGAQNAELLARALKTLGERDARILALYYNEEFTYAEIGDLLGVTESRVCQLHGRALARLRAAVSKMEEVI
ncbi:MAG TPA: FliA/WhiG family RNA polymerase sigma factor [Kofleriaceae bacterium]|nr:FliA/WhiG family RNA polymerase sigma factor [Kofleriaceae bacterium]